MSKQYRFLQQNSQRPPQPKMDISEDQIESIEIDDRDDNMARPPVGNGLQPPELEAMTSDADHKSETTIQNEVDMDDEDGGLFGSGSEDEAVG